MAFKAEGVDGIWGGVLGASSAAGLRFQVSQFCDGLRPFVSDDPAARTDGSEGYREAVKRQISEIVRRLLSWAGWVLGRVLAKAVVEATDNGNS